MEEKPGKADKVRVKQESKIPLWAIQGFLFYRLNLLRRFYVVAGAIQQWPYEYHTGEKPNRCTASPIIAAAAMTWVTFHL